MGRGSSTDPRNLDPRTFEREAPRAVARTRTLDNGVSQHLDNDDKLVKVTIPNGIEYELPNGEKTMGVEALIYFDKVGRVHRENQEPAIERHDGGTEIYTHGKWIDSTLAARSHPTA